MVARYLITSSSIVSFEAFISTGIAISARIAVSPVGAFLLAACLGGVIVHLAVGASVRLSSSKSLTSATPTPTSRISSVFRIMGGNSQSDRDFGHEGLLFSV